MKRSLIFDFALLSMLALTACSQNDDAPVLNEDSQVFTLTVSNDDAVTRAGRPLYSQVSAQNIDSVKLVIYNTSDNSIAYATTIDTWMSNSNVIATSDGNGRQTTIVLKGNDKLAAGTYKAYAVGYSVNSDYAELYKNLSVLTKGKTFNAITVQTAGDAEEIFAGTTEGNAQFTVGADGALSQRIVLKRQVAGTYGYFTNIPAKGAKDEVATTLRLVASNKLKEVILDGFDLTNAVNGKTSFGNASAQYADGMHTGYEIYSITLTDWFTAGDSNGDGVLNEEDTWQKDAAITDPGVSFKRGSVFGGKFLVPFAAVDGTNTLQLQLLDGSNNILKYWNINLRAKQETVNTVSGADDNSVEETTSVYSILRNSLYTIGLRKAGNDGGEEPDDNPDTDDPTDLNKGQELIIEVNGAWDNIPDMSLD